MNSWPDGWTDNGAQGPQGGGPPADPTRRMPHVSRGGGGGAPRRGSGGYGGAEGPGAPGYRGGPQEPYPPVQRQAAEPPLPPELDPHGRGGSGGPGGPGRGGGSGGGGYSSGTGPRRPRANWRKRITWTLATLVVLVLVAGVATYFWADSKLDRDDKVLADYSDRPASGKGTNYLIVGSDSREGMSKEDEKKLHTGAAEGKRTDSMMILHTGDNGSTLMSIPRDSYMTIPPFTGSSTGRKYPASRHKINASYAMGGGQLLARTIEYNTGLHIDHYAEIGFNGFVQMVDGLGGVDMCFDKPLKDKASGADFQKGCHTLNGAQSLAFVRQRHQMADQDLGRMKNQQKFLSTLAHQAASPWTIINPFKLYPTLGAGLDALTVDKDMSLIDLAHMFFAMKGVSSGDGKSMTVPIATANYPTPNDGVALKWDMNRAKTLFDELKNDQKVTVSGGAG